jgi:hypothetical protein
MGALASPRWLTTFAGLIAALILGLNAKLIWDQLFAG